eukprot:7843427-Pyramimonas_sp.AAC.1
MRIVDLTVFIGVDGHTMLSGMRQGSRTFSRGSPWVVAAGGAAAGLCGLPWASLVCGLWENAVMYLYATYCPPGNRVVQDPPVG